MYATIGTAIPTGDAWTFEPKYDGIRVLAYADAAGTRLITRNGKDKAAQFPEVVASLERLRAEQGGVALVLDGEIVALDARGRPARFQELQGRMHLKDPVAVARAVRDTPAALVAFDLLAEGSDVLLDRPWAERRRRLEARLRALDADARVRLTESAVGRGAEELARARRDGWEGIIAKRVDARYVPGARSRDWLKLKVEYRQEFVVGGFTEPRNSREHLGALLLGVFDDGRFEYVGHTGGGFTRAELAAMRRRLAPLERATPPFAEAPRTNERAHWVRPAVVVEVKFSEWTEDGRLRQPIFLGVRDDKPARAVTREAASVQQTTADGGGERTMSTTKRTGRARARVGAARSAQGARSGGAKGGAGSDVVAQLRRIEREGGDGELRLAGGKTLRVTSLDKVYFPEPGFTKGDLMRYYALVAPRLLPLMADRPLALKRYPDGVGGEHFFQQKPGRGVPEGVRVERVATEKGVEPRFVGGDLLTLLYTVQLGTIEVHSWHSRVGSLDDADYAILDLDPGPEASFSRVLEVARAIGAELERRGVHGAPKTSGSRGIHVFIPLPPRTGYDAAAELAESVARAVVAALPGATTLERSLDARPADAVYVDHLQNARGKTVASAWSARARALATVSMPLAWTALARGVDPAAYTIATVPRRLGRTRDPWGEAMKARNGRSAVAKQTARRTRS